MRKTSSSLPDSYPGLSGSNFIDTSSSGRAGCHPVTLVLFLACLRPCFQSCVWFLFLVLFLACSLPAFWDLVSRLVFFLPVSLDYYLAEFNIHSCHEFLVCLGIVQTILPCLPWTLCPSALCCHRCRSRFIIPSCACLVLVMSRHALPLGLGCVRNTNCLL